MVDINDIIFEKYREGKIDSQKMVLLLEAGIKKESNKKETTMDDSIFQNVFDLIHDYLPDGWKKTVLFVGYTTGSYSMKFYTKTNSRYIDCFSFAGVSKNDLTKLFKKIDRVLKTERNKLTEKNKWTVLTMVVDSTGAMKTSFDYDDHSNDMIAYEKKWKKKYLTT
jgi:hypothetical protein